MQKSVTIPKNPARVLRVQDGMQLMKLRLSSLVVFSAMMGFLLAPGITNWLHFFILLFGGILVTGAANGFNQVIERDTDRLMDRTRNRPLADHRMPVSEALWICTLAGSAGIFMLTWLNILSGFLGLLSILLYTLAYTPLKKKTPFAVFVGAIPGAIPPMLGWVAATGSIGLEGWLHFEMPVAFYISTAIILLSSATMHFAIISVKKNNLTMVRNALFVTLGLGLAFIFTQFLGWNELIQNKVFYTGNPAGSFVYVISGLHLAHIAGGIIGLIVVSAKAIMEKYNAHNYTGLSSCAIYWHFLDGLWIYLFVFLAVYR